MTQRILPIGANIPVKETTETRGVSSAERIETAAVVQGTSATNILSPIDDEPDLNELLIFAVTVALALIRPRQVSFAPLV